MKHVIVDENPTYEINAKRKEIRRKLTEVCDNCQQSIRLCNEEVELGSSNMETIDYRISKTESDIRTVNTGQVSDSEGIAMLEEDQAAKGETLAKEYSIDRIHEKIAKLSERNVVLYDEIIVLQNGILELYPKLLEYDSKILENDQKKLDELRYYVKKHKAGLKLAKKLDQPDGIKYQQEHLDRAKKDVPFTKECIKREKKILKGDKVEWKNDIKTLDGYIASRNRHASGAERDRNREASWKEHIAHSEEVMRSSQEFIDRYETAQSETMDNDASGARR